MEISSKSSNKSLFPTLGRLDLSSVVGLATATSICDIDAQERFHLPFFEHVGNINHCYSYPPFEMWYQYKIPDLFQCLYLDGCITIVAQQTALESTWKVEMQERTENSKVFSADCFKGTTRSTFGLLDLPCEN